MKKIKILFIGYGTNLGGIETFIYNLVKNANLEKFNFSFLIYDDEQKIIFYEELKNMNCNFFKITKRTENYFSFLKDLKEVYTNNDFDYIHCNLMDFSCFERITFAKKYSKANIIIHSHIGSKNFIKKRGLIPRVLNTIGKYLVSKINTLNVSCGTEAGKFMFGKKDFVVFHNGINIKKYLFDENKKEQIRKKLNINTSDTVIGLVATFLSSKNHKFLLDLFEQYHSLNNNSKLLLIGEGPLKQKIYDIVVSKGLKENVLFLGKREDVYSIYSAMDMYVMPSFCEGLSIAICEAQINGLKCYTSTNVDSESNITGNVEFLDLKKGAHYWAEYIYNSNNERDKNVLKKIPEEFDSNNSYKKIYNFYKKNLK